MEDPATTHELLVLPRTQLPAPGRDLERALVLLSGPQAGRIHAIGAQVVTIGRAIECTIPIDYIEISRQHASIERTPEQAFVLRDLGSRNGTFVNGQLVTEHILQVGDRVTLGTATALLFTQRDHLEEQLLHQQRMEAIGRLAGGIAHDFNNLLGAVLANASVLQRLTPETTLGNPDVAEMLDDIRTAAQRGCELTQQLLLFARREPEEHGPIDVSKLLHDVVRLCRRTFGPNITIETLISPGIFVLGNTAQIHQVVMNLLINARDAMPSGGRLDVRLDSTPAARSRRGVSPWAHITVTDTGVGMDEETQVRAFEPFFTTKAADRGTGLGLATVYGIVTGHGGEVGVRSEPGSGSTFEVWLPEREREPRPIVPTPIATAFATAHPRATVLLVDDDELYVRSSARVIEESGHTVITARSGTEALEVFRLERDRVRLILLDLVMPGMTGEETCRELRALDPRVKVLLMSGYPTAASESVKRAGADGFLGKPFDLAALERATLEVLAR